MKKTYLAVAISVVALLSVSAAGARAFQQPSSKSGVPQRAAVVAVIKSYEQALNASDLEGVLKLYTDDAVVLAPNSPSAVGINAVRGLYTGIFQAIDIELTLRSPR